MVIYEPKGRAREYAALACNLYTGCTHGCLYCYAPGCLHKTHEAWCANVRPRDGILGALIVDTFKLHREKCKDEILFCFTSDPYCLGIDTSTTRKALEIVGDAGLRATVLTKGGTAACRDFDLLKKYGFRFGSTIVFVDDDWRKHWEPNAAPIYDRVQALKIAHEMGIETWVSMEPVIDPTQALAVIEAIHPFVDSWKVGKINHMKNTTDWRRFLVDVTALLDSVGADYYIKLDLAAYGE